MRPVSGMRQGGRNGDKDHLQINIKYFRKEKEKREKYV